MSTYVTYSKKIANFSFLTKKLIIQINSLERLKKEII